MVKKKWPPKIITVSAFVQNSTVWFFNVVMPQNVVNAVKPPLLNYHQYPLLSGALESHVLSQISQRETVLSCRDSINLFAPLMTKFFEKGI